LDLSGNPATAGVARWPPTGDTAGCRLRQPQLTEVSLISLGQSSEKHGTEMTAGSLLLLLFKVDNIDHKRVAHTRIPSAGFWS